MQQDKIIHFLVGAGLTGVSLIVCHLIHCPAWLCVMPAIAAGAGKEIIWDAGLKRGNPDIWDFVATVAGAIMALVLWFGI